MRRWVGLGCGLRGRHLDRGDGAGRARIGRAAADVYGGEVVEIEYTDNAESAYTDACADRGATIAVILRDREVVPRGEADYVYRAC